MLVFPLRFYVWNYGKEQVWLTRCWADRFRRNQETQKGGCYGDAETSRASSMERTRGTMTDEQKQKMIDKVIHDFDFEKVRALMLVMDWTWPGHGVPTEQKLWDKARKLCEKVMEHDDRECWWATTGGLLAYFDQKNGLYLAFIPERARARIKED